MSRELKKILTFVGLGMLCFGCTKAEEAEREKVRQMNAHAEYIYRNHDEQPFELPAPKHTPRADYPWEKPQPSKK